MDGRQGDYWPARAPEARRPAPIVSQRGVVSRSRAPIPLQVKPQKTDKTRLRREHTLWWVSGIVLGAAILTQFRDYVRAHFWDEEKNVGGWSIGDVYCLIRRNPRWA